MLSKIEEDRITCIADHLRNVSLMATLTPTVVEKYVELPQRKVNEQPIAATQVASNVDYQGDSPRR